MMRPALAAGAALCLSLSVVLAPEPPPEGRGLLGSIGASMGGLRVMVIDALFLRAEAQKKAGRIDDAAALYETVLELDPENEFGTIYLVNTIVDELMPQAPTVEARFSWWKHARELLMRALERRPASGPLNARAGTLILDAAYADEAFRPLLEEELGLPRLVALRNLRVAMHAAGTLPRQGRGHLLRIALITPLIAAKALADESPEVYAEAVATAEETIRRRGAVLAQMRIDERGDGDLLLVLTRGMQAVEAVRRALDGHTTRAEVRRRMGAYDALVPENTLTPALRTLLAK